MNRLLYMFVLSSTKELTLRDLPTLSSLVMSYKIPSLDEDVLATWTCDLLFGLMRLSESATVSL